MAFRVAGGLYKVLQTAFRVTGRLYKVLQTTFRVTGGVCKVLQTAFRVAGGLCKIVKSEKKCSAFFANSAKRLKREASSVILYGYGPRKIQQQNFVHRQCVGGHQSVLTRIRRH